MNIIDKYKEWFTLPEAAKRIGCDITDLLQFCIQNQLKLSARIPFPTMVRPGKLITCAKGETLENYGKAGPIEFKNSIHKPNTYNKSLVQENSIKNINGIFDLAMIGDEKLIIEKKYKKETTGYNLTRINTSGIYIKGESNIIYQLCRKGEFEDLSVFDEYGSLLECYPEDQLPGLYCPLYEMPDDISIVIRNVNLQDFKQALKKKEPEVNTTAETKEKHSLLKIIITMAVAGYKHDPTTKGSTAKEISEDAEKLGISISEDTVRKWLKKASEELDQNIPL